MDFLSLLARIWDPISTPLALGGGVILTHLWQRYLNRLAGFRWTALHYPVAESADAPNLGRLEVRWNDTPVHNVKFCVVEFENESGRDFTSVAVQFWYEDETLFLGHGEVVGTAQLLPWTPEYATLLQRLQVPLAQQSPDDIKAAMSRREFVMPIFNRGTQLRFNFLVSVQPDRLPLLNAACDHLGVRMYQRPAKQMLLGVVRDHAAWAGLLVGLALAIVIGVWIDTVWLAALLAFLLGSFSLLLGVPLVKYWQWLTKAIG